jgi:molybdopterin-guanine dinucleotide biosynthesis protein
VFGDRAVTEAAGKDTGRYWEAGAADVRWVVAARGQEHRGLSAALADLDGFTGVLVEGNRILERLTRPRLALLVAHPSQREIKASARRILDRIDALFVLDAALSRSIGDPSRLVGAPPGSRRWPVYGPADLDRLADELRR